MIIINPNLRPYLEKKTGYIPPDAVFIGHLDEDGSIMAVVAFGHHTVHDCEVFLAGETGRRWWSKDFARAVFGLAFDRLDKARLTSRVDANKPNIVRLNERFGFVKEGRLRNMLGDRDVIVLGQIKSECRYIKHEQAEHTEPAKS